MARFAEVALVIVFIAANAVNASEHTCSDDQFKCKTSCIGKNLVCNGRSECKTKCIDLGGRRDECEDDTGDEDDCDYPKLIPLDRRINCTEANPFYDDYDVYEPVSDEQTCHSIISCVWDNSTSTCFRKWARPGLECPICEKQDSGIWECPRNETLGNCDLYLAERKTGEGRGDINDQRCMIENGKTSCATAQYCEENNATANCSESMQRTAAQHMCGANQFVCIYECDLANMDYLHCIDYSLTCNGTCECYKECKTWGGKWPGCHLRLEIPLLACSFHTDMINDKPPNKTIHCVDWRNDIITDNKTCHEWNCEWDPITSTCYYEENSFKDNQIDAGYDGDGNYIGLGDNIAGGHFVEKTHDQTKLSHDSTDNEKVKLEKSNTNDDDEATDGGLEATTEQAKTEETTEEDTDGGLKDTDEDQGSIIKSDIIACIIALTLVMIAI